jgi:hypothetical protein
MRFTKWIEAVRQIAAVKLRVDLGCSISCQIHQGKLFGFNIFAVPAGLKNRPHGTA